MKRILVEKLKAGTFIMIIALAVFTLPSCKKNEGIEDAVSNDDFYVKYIISSTYPRIFSNWSVSTPDGNYTRNDFQTRHWEQTYGPIKKGFKCSVKVGNGEPAIEIYVSKNQEPFTLKSSMNGQSAFYIVQ